MVGRKCEPYEGQTEIKAPGGALRSPVNANTNCSPVCRRNERHLVLLVDRNIFRGAVVVVVDVLPLRLLIYLTLQSGTLMTTFGPLCRVGAKHALVRRSRTTLSPSITSHRFFTNDNGTRTAAPAPAPQEGERLRVAVVGGGCAGLSSALHLAPLVEQGYLASPIDIFDATPSSEKGRPIGVGVWSTGLDPFQVSDRQSHKVVYEEMSRHGTWVGDAGYRTPDGSWLLKSYLPTTAEECVAQNMPALLFLREQDMLLSLQKAIHWEERRGAVRMHRDGNKTRVTGIEEDSSQPWSARLRLASDTFSERDYHLIVAADGTQSMLRKRYGGFNLATQRLIGTAGLPSQNNLETALPSESWDDDLHLEATRLQDRNYTVFRGNSPLTNESMGEGGVSFQTWGTHKSMRFATVPMLVPGGQGKREERQVWFATINDAAVTGEEDPTKRKQLLMEAFSSWHDPITKTMEATPSDEMLMERAVAHRHCIGPVVSMNKVIQRIRGTRPPNSGEGPSMVFVGDAFMTVDPILAQGFTVAMEGAFATKNSVQHSCQVSDPNSTLAFDPYRKYRVGFKCHGPSLLVSA